jgi:hypothetical protein
MVFDDIEYGSTYAKWSICVRVEEFFCSNKYVDNIRFILMDNIVSTKHTQWIAKM